MGQPLLKQLLPALERIRWPASSDVTELGRKTYEVGLEKVNEFRGDPKILASALRTFQSGDSRPYALAGAAYTLLAAAQEEDGSYAQVGIEVAMEWLEKAQELAPDVLEINMIEAFLYIYGGRYQDARTILDYLRGTDPNDYYLLTAEATLWQHQEKLEEAVYWYQKAIASADTVPRKLRLRSKLGDCYLEFGNYRMALEIYREAVHFAKENPWLWHNMSLAHWHLEDYKEAARCNRKALDLLDFQDAREVEASLKQKLGSGGLAGLLFGR